LSVGCLMSVVNDPNDGRCASNLEMPLPPRSADDNALPLQWVSCFENVTAILFLVALSGYDECLVEDKDSVSIAWVPLEVAT
jgi:hypothetical protein